MVTSVSITITLTPPQKSTWTVQEQIQGATDLGTRKEHALRRTELNTSPRAFSKLCPK